MTHRFISTAIPYVNAAPHIGFALELIVADVLARYERLQGGRSVYFLSGTDDNSLKNALAAEQAGIAVRDLIAANAKQFRELAQTLDVSYGDFLSTSTDPRHAPAVAELWRACRRNGEIYEGRYEGLYCVGCEQFYTESELYDGLCPDHGTLPEPVAERNYFFRLSRYRNELIRLIGRDEIAILPKQKKNEVLAFLDGPLQDLSISRSVERARGWGIPVPDDPTQIVYVWFDALANYISALGYAQSGPELRTWWTEAARITHVIGKGVTRFHAVYWPAILLSAGVRPPTEILVHGYVTVGGNKIGKSAGNAISPSDACAPYGTDALRYYLLRHVGSRRDGDFSFERLDEVYAHELANDLGNLLGRTTALARRYGAPEPAASTLAEGLDDEVGLHIEQFALDRALDAVWRVIGETNAYVNRTEPWVLAKHGRKQELGVVLAELHGTLAAIGRVLRPFLPQTAQRVLSALSSSGPGQLFPRAATKPERAALALPGVTG